MYAAHGCNVSVIVIKNGKTTQAKFTFVAVSKDWREAVKIKNVIIKWVKSLPGGATTTVPQLTALLNDISAAWTKTRSSSQDLASLIQLTMATLQCLRKLAGLPGHLYSKNWKEILKIVLSVSLASLMFYAAFNIVKNGGEVVAVGQIAEVLDVVIGTKKLAALASKFYGSGDRYWLKKYESFCLEYIFKTMHLKYLPTSFFELLKYFGCSLVP